MLNREKYLGPIQKLDLGNGSSIQRYGRVRLSDGHWEYTFRGIINRWFLISSDGSFPTREEALVALDKRLLKKGYVFLTQEQWDKVSVLI